MVAVITINYNLASDTIRCIDSVIASEYEDFLIYLVDNGSSQEDYQTLTDSLGSTSHVRILRLEKNCGYVGGVNHGLKVALEDRPDYFLVMNNDTIIDPMALSHLVNCSKRHYNRAIVTGKVYYYDRPDVLQHTGVVFLDRRFLTTIYPGRNETDAGQFNVEMERDSLDDVFWLLPAGLLKDVGLYCEYFFLYAEQGDYAQRARRKGYKLIFTPDAKIWHKVSMTTGGGNNLSLPACYWRGQGLFVFQYRNLKTKYLIVMMLKNLYRMSSRALLMKNQERKRAIAKLQGYLWGFGWALNKRTNTGENPYLP
jgi:GT2 family glycosyltransferase